MDDARYVAQHVVKYPFYFCSRDNDCFESSFAVFLVEKLVEPWLFRPYCSANIEAQFQKEVDDVRADVAVCCCDQDFGSLGDCILLLSHI